MDGIVKELILIDQSANAVINKALREKNELPELIKKGIEIQTSRIELNAKKVINQMYKQSNILKEEKIRQIETRAQEKMKSIQALFEQNNEAWRQQIFNRILHG